MLDYVKCWAAAIVTYQVGGCVIITQLHLDWCFVLFYCSIMKYCISYIGHIWFIFLQSFVKSDKKEIFSVPVIMRWGREKHDDKDEDSDCESKIQTVAAGVSPAESAFGFTNHYTVTVLQTKTKVFRVVFQSFITGIATIIIGGGTIVAHKMKVFIRFISRERGWGGLPVRSTIIRSSSGETRSCVRTKIIGISWNNMMELSGMGNNFNLIYPNPSSPQFSKIKALEFH